MNLSFELASIFSPEAMAAALVTIGTGGGLATVGAPRMATKAAAATNTGDLMSMIDLVQWSGRAESGKSA
jgi:hypothetical protein